MELEEKHPQTIAAVSEYEFPEEIIHQIQSFMGERKAARTTLVSKSWYGAWYTRPKLSFDQYDLGKGKWFRKYARKTLQRYENLNLKIQTFLVRMYKADLDLARELILKAIKLGATDLTMEFPEVVKAETLARLSVHHVAVDLNKPLTSSNLKSLTLSRKAIKSGLWLQFPCLKTLVIRQCNFKPNGEDVIRICSPSLECISISFCWFTNAKLEFDVPNIQKLELRGHGLPCLEMKASNREWESYVYITIEPVSGMVRASWLRWLNHFVKLLSPSRVSLALYISHPVGLEDGCVGDGLAIPAVENLRISGLEVSPALLNALFWSCGPNFVNIQRRCMRGIEKENVEQFQHLSSLPWNILLDDSRNHWEEFVRFQLK